MPRIDTSLPIKTTGGESVEIIETAGRDGFPFVGYIGEAIFPSAWTSLGFFNDTQVPHINDIANVQPERKKTVRYVAWMGDNLFQISEQRPELTPKVLALAKVVFAQGNFDD